MKKFLALFLLFFLSAFAFAQKDSIPTKKLTFTGDFRFRIEQDWNSRKTDGSYRENRSRLRYRFRFGANYLFNQWAEVGMRLRSGFIEKQQDPHLTLGDGFEEFSSVPIGFEKLFFKAQYKNYMGWLGKNTFPFEKQNELFWSDNIYPDGVFVSGIYSFNNRVVSSLKVNAGHFILSSSGSTFSNDQYVQGLQIVTKHLNNNFTLFPSFFYFHQMPNIPDGNETFYLNYSIVQVGAKAKVLDNPHIGIGIDYYHNLENLSRYDSIPQKFKNQKNGLVASVNVGKLQKRGDWAVGTTLSYIEKYAIVDFFAQNDWVRWDYSSFGSPDGRLSNFKGIELNAAYLIRKNFRLKMRYFVVDQLIPFGAFKETGNRIRLDLDIGF